MTGLAPDQGILGRSGNFIFNQGKSGAKKDILKNQKIKEVIESLLFHFRVVTFSILSQTSS